MAEGMEKDFFWSQKDEPHASRRRQIMASHPEVKQLFGPDHWAPAKITVVVVLQLSVAVYISNASWWTILLVSYFFGAFCNHNLFLAIHELSHNLACNSPFYNRLLGIFANLPVGIPMSVTFQKYHLEHHRYQGVDGMDMDIPSDAEGRIVTNTGFKLLWVLFQLFFYAFRPLFLNPKPPGLWEIGNLTAQVALDAALVYYAGWRALAYLILSTFVGGGIHPIAGHFISEHYVFKKGQETYSYYGPLNLLTWNVGYHNEHHDFPRIAGSRLPELKKMAPEFYEGLAYHKSWTNVIYRYVTDPTVGPFSRTKRKQRSSSSAKTE
ncbi:hypothetical protein R1sor_027369 [Riccia sorocarpa]|uniref:Sphingolipid delta(4)-desaturase DES1-like n=1 Tax=Riccia sorocarpa TaxID=122646 RepID=A0ABD3GFI4_9MARC